MPKIAYITRRFDNSSTEVIEQANSIIANYAAQGYSLTLRQLYYQFVARDLISNTQKEYKRIGSIINKGRLAGLIDWNAVVDRTRELERPSFWGSPDDMIRAAADSYNIDMWRDQGSYVEVWVEKEAMADIVARACDPWDVPYFCCRGYTSQSELWGAAMRLIGKERRGKKVLIIHLGDHDPSGMDMTRDIEDRLALFGSNAAVDRIALNMDQVEQYNPPPNPAKVTDSRFTEYRDNYGDECWELDALEPQTLNEMITRRIRATISPSAWERSENQRESERRELTAAADYWPQVTSWMADEGYTNED